MRHEIPMHSQNVTVRCGLLGGVIRPHFFVTDEGDTKMVNDKHP